MKDNLFGLTIVCTKESNSTFLDKTCARSNLYLLAPVSAENNKTVQSQIRKRVITRVRLIGKRLSYRSDLDHS